MSTVECVASANANTLNRQFNRQFKSKWTRRVWIRGVWAWAFLLHHCEVQKSRPAQFYSAQLFKNPTAQTPERQRSSLSGSRADHCGAHGVPGRETEHNGVLVWAFYEFVPCLTKPPVVRWSPTVKTATPYTGGGLKLGLEILRWKYAGNLSYI